MKRVLFIILCFIPFVIVNASGSINLSTTSITLEEGKSTTFTITADNSAGRLDISSTNTSVVTVSSGSIFVDSNSTTITVNANNSGNATIKIVLTDVATYDGDELTGTKEINVAVKAKSESKPSNINGSTNSDDKKEEDKKEEVKEVEEKVETTGDTKIEPKIMLNITTFNIYGYSLNFDENVYEYDLDIDSDVSKIYLETTCNDCEITGDKWIDINNKDQIVVKYTKETTTKEYKINLKKSVLASKEETSNKSNTNIILLIISIILGIAVIVLLILLLNKKSKKEVIPVGPTTNTEPVVEEMPVAYSSEVPIEPEPISYVPEVKEEVQEETILPIEVEEVQNTENDTNQDTLL